MPRKQLSGWEKFFDNALFFGAEQETIAKENATEKLKFIQEYSGPMESYANDQTGSMRCALCGGIAAVNFSDVHHPDFGWITICETCSTEKAKDPSQLAWNRKRPLISI